MNTAHLICALLAIAACTAVENIPEEATGTYDPRAKDVMDALATPDAVRALAASGNADALVFTEDRAHPVRWSKALPQRWLDDRAAHTGSFHGQAQPGEFYVFQLGVFAVRRDLGPLALEMGALGGGAGSIPATALRCFTLGGVDNTGHPFTKDAPVAKDHVRVLWLGIQIPVDARGAYQGSVTVRDAQGFHQAVALDLEVAGAVLADHGDHDSWRLSRLRWLDSTIGLDDDVVTAPYIPLARQERTVALLGRRLTLDACGLPERIETCFNGSNTAILPAPTRSLLVKPFRFVVDGDGGTAAFTPGPLVFTREQKGAIAWRTTARSGDLRMQIDGTIEYDGAVNYHAVVDTEGPATIRDLRLECAITPDAALFMGLGQHSGRRPATVDWKWDAKNNQDGFWIGAVNGGFRIQFTGGNWRTPLVNCYYGFRPLLIPDSWAGGQGASGGIRLTTIDGGALAMNAWSGPRTLQPGKPLDFAFNLLLTPFHTLDTDQQWSLRYLHKTQGVEDADYRDLTRVKEKGANVINIHHNKEQNPTINYPYFDRSMPLLKQCVDDAHAQGIKVKIYYTTREITNNLPELFPFWSLDGEIICPSPGHDGVLAKPVTNGKGPQPWLVEHLGETGFIPAWRETLKGRYGGMLDLAVITTPESRLDNFYLEGLAFTLRATGIDGLYIDDTALGRKSFQRAHRIFAAAGKPLLVDMHSWSHLNKLAGNTPSAYLFLQNFPYYHRLWFGEGHDYNKPADHWLVELSGIPFGLMGEMLQGGGNKWRGMLFGMTQRLGWSGDPRPLWKLWDEIGMAGTHLTGWWDADCPVKTSDPTVPASVYRRPGMVMISIASWAKAETTVKLAIDWQALGFAAPPTTLKAPAVEGFQGAAGFACDAGIAVPPGKGWLLIANAP